MEAKRDSIGFLGYRYLPQSKHLIRPILPDGSPSELLDGKNLLHQDLTLTTMLGFEKMFATQLGESGKRRCMGIHPYIATDNTIYWILCYPSKIYSYKAGDTAPTDITGAVTLTGDEITHYFDATYFVDTTSTYVPWIILTNGKDPMIKWNGTGNCATLGGTPPLARYITSFGGHLVASWITSGGASYGQRDFRSDVLEAEDWSGGLAGSVDLRQDATNIRGSIIFGDIRFVLKESSTTVSRFTGYDPPFVYSQEELPIGLAAPRTLIKCWKYDYGFFLAPDLNCYVIRKDGMYEAVGDNITYKLREYSNDETIRYSFAFYFPALDYIFLAIPSTDHATNYCDLMFGFDLGTYLKTGEKIWTPPIEVGKYISAAGVGKFKGSYSIGDLGELSSDGTIGGLSGTIGSFFQEAAFSQVIFADNDGYVYGFDETLATFDGTPITWEAVCKDLRLASDWADFFRLQEYEVLFKNSQDIAATANVYLSNNGGNSYDSGQSLEVYNSNLYSEEETEDSTWYDVVAKKFRMKISGTHRIRLLGQRFFGSEEGRR